MCILYRYVYIYIHTYKFFFKGDMGYVRSLEGDLFWIQVVSLCEIL